MQINSRFFIVLTVITVAVLTIVILTAYFLGKSGLETSKDDSNYSFSSQESSRVSKLEQEVSSISSVLDRLVGQVEQQNKLLSSVESALPSTIDENLVEDNLNEEGVFQAEEAAKKKLSQFNLINSEQQKREIEQRQLYLDNVFEQETIDEVWANEASIEVGEVFLKPELVNGQVANVDCRSSLCRMDILVEKMDTQEASNFEIHLLTGLSKSFRGGLKVRQIKNADGTTSLVAYGARTGHKFPKYDAENLLR